MTCLYLDMLLFGYGLAMGGYLLEAYRAKGILLRITEGAIVTRHD
ncbi:MAG TPA: hypothetical protein VFT90_01055 [Chryseosolibacter sp.]|nr:hypothetical protein [Chryseosolibacter sp.]